MSYNKEAVISDVVGWLTNARGGEGYENVDAAIQAGDADLDNLYLCFQGGWQ